MFSYILEGGTSNKTGTHIIEQRKTSKSMDLKYDDLFQSLINLESFVKSRPQLWFTVIDDKEISEDWISEVLSNLSF